MELRNIHFTPPAPETPETPAAQDPQPAPVLRLRKVNVSPAEEYTLRAGEVAPVSDAIAAVILSKKGRATISLKGVVIDRADLGGKRSYWHPDSRLCNDLSARERKLWYVINPQAPSVIHLLDETGRYLESLPQKDRPEVLNTEQQAAEMAKCQRQIRRVAEHLQRLHQPDTDAALDAARHNAATMTRFVQTLPAAPSTHVNRLTASPVADRLAAAARDTAADRQTYRPLTKPRAGTPTAEEILLSRTRTPADAECPY